LIWAGPVIPAYLFTVYLTPTKGATSCRGFSDFSMDPHNFRNEEFGCAGYPVIGVRPIVGVNGSLINYEKMTTSLMIEL